MGTIPCLHEVGIDELYEGTNGTATNKHAEVHVRGAGLGLQCII